MLRDIHYVYIAQWSSIWNSYDILVALILCRQYEWFGTVNVSKIIGWQITFAWSMRMAYYDFSYNACFRYFFALCGENTSLDINKNNGLIWLIHPRVKSIIQVDKFLWSAELYKIGSLLKKCLRENAWRMRRFRCSLSHEIYTYFVVTLSIRNEYIWLIYVYSPGLFSLVLG